MAHLRMASWLRSATTASMLVLASSRILAQNRVAPVTDADLKKPDVADWLMWRRTYDGAGYSPLQQISTRNVKRLAMVWSRAIAAGHNEATPLVHAGVMYLPNPNDVIEAVDARTGDFRWIYRRKQPEDLKNPFDVKRNIAIYGRLVISTGMDQTVFALDADRGSLVWETRVRDYHLGGNQGSGPIIVDGKVISGRSCEPPGGADECVITAHDANTGKELWRTRTIPREGEPGDDTWGNIREAQRRHVGTWMPPTYDLELRLLYIGTSVTAPAPKFMLAGSDKTYLYHNSTLAINPDNGKIIWHYQHLVDQWDLDHTFERLVVDTRVAPDPRAVLWINPRLRQGQVRKVITGIPGKTGIVYTLDRETGEFLWATPTVKQTVVSSIDGATGRVTVNAAAVFDSVGDTRTICPSSWGGKSWDPGAYSPLRKAMFMPLVNTCAKVQSSDPPRSGSFLAIRGISGDIELSDRMLGRIQAVSVETGRTLWQYSDSAAPTALLATAGGLVFGGDVSGWFRAFDDQTGSVLWEINLGSPVVGPPISFSVAGRQFIAVSTGSELHSQGLVQIANRSWASSAGGFNNSPVVRPTNNTLFVFALNQR